MSCDPAQPHARDSSTPRSRTPSSSLLLVISLPVWIVVAGVLLHSAGNLDFEVYRLGVRAWLGGNDMYGTLPATSSGVTLPLAMLLEPVMATLDFGQINIISWR